MKYIKICIDTPYDPKFAVVAKRAQISKGEAIALWLVLLDHAKQNMPRGSIADLDLEQAALALNLAVPAVEKALSAFRDKKMLSEAGYILNWKKHQDSSAERVARWRAVRKEKLPKANPDDPEETLLRRQRMINQRLKKMEKNKK